MFCIVYHNLKKKNRTSLLQFWTLCFWLGRTEQKTTVAHRREEVGLSLQWLVLKCPLHPSHCNGCLTVHFGDKPGKKSIMMKNNKGNSRWEVTQRISQHPEATVCSVSPDTVSLALQPAPPDQGRNRGRGSMSPRRHLQDSLCRGDTCLKSGSLICELGVSFRNRQNLFALKPRAGNLIHNTVSWLMAQRASVTWEGWWGPFSAGWSRAWSPFPWILLFIFLF